MLVKKAGYTQAANRMNGVLPLIKQWPPPIAAENGRLGCALSVSRIDKSDLVTIIEKISVDNGALIDGCDADSKRP